MTGFTRLGQIIGAMIGTIALIDLIALILQGSRQLATIRGENNKVHRAISLGIVGGLFGIYATISGVPLENGAVLSVRDVGPMMAGCLGGPLSGLIAGVIAGVQRLLYGLPDITAGSTIPCSISTLGIGLFCGLLFKRFAGSKKRGLWAILIAVVMELFHLFLVFLYFWITASLEASLTLIAEVTPAFLLANGIAFGLLVYVLDMVAKYKKAEQHEKQVETELNVATSIQSDMLPSIFPDFPGKKEFSLDAIMNPAKEIGGDFYDFFFIDEDHFAFLVADVSGKGVPAALFMVISKTIIKNNIQSGLSPCEALRRANVQLCDGNESGMFVTAWLGVLEISSGKLTYVNAGHNPPLIKRGDRPLEYLRDLSGFILAGRKKSTYKEFEMHLSDGDKIFLYTDGVTEAMNKEGEQYGEERLSDCFSGVRKNAAASEIIQMVTEDMEKFVGEAEQYDDTTMLVLMMSGEYERIKVKTDLSNFEVLAAFMTEKLEKEQISTTLINKMNVVLDEIYSNMVKYSGSEALVFGVSVYHGRIAMQMEYGGELFDVTTTQTPDITLPAKDRPIGGLGLFIVKKIMDRVDYRVENGRNVLTLLKKYEVGAKNE